MICQALALYPVSLQYCYKEPSKLFYLLSSRLVTCPTEYGYIYTCLIYCLFIDIMSSSIRDHVSVSMFSLAGVVCELCMLLAMWHNNY